MQVGTNSELTSVAVVSNMGDMNRVLWRRDGRLLWRPHQARHEAREARLLPQHRYLGLPALVRVALRLRQLILGHPGARCLLGSQGAISGGEAGGLAKGRTAHDTCVGARVRDWRKGRAVEAGGRLGGLDTIENRTTVKGSADKLLGGLQAELMLVGMRIGGTLVTEEGGGSGSGVTLALALALCGVGVVRLRV